MELFSPEFFSALAAIILIDLVLAGDNAIVIALAARGLPAHLQKRAIVWGTLGAVAVRSAMTVTVVELLKIPGLLLVGGLMLVWIAFRLLVPGDKGEVTQASATGAGFWGAMRTIVVADAVMGLDNVLGVAGAAHGSFLLVVLGLLVSIPIVVWGSRLVLGFVNRYPVIIYLGGAVLAWTAAKMITGEPVIRAYLETRPGAGWAVYVLVMGGVLGLGYASQRRRRMWEAWSPRGRVPVPGAEPRVLQSGGTSVKRILLPVNGSQNAMNAVRHVIERHLERQDLEVHLLHVRAPLTRHISRFLGRRERLDWHRGQAETALAPARHLLDKWGIPYVVHVERGDKAEVIDALARRQGCHQIVMGMGRRSPLLQWLRGSIPARVIERSAVPVEVIAGRPAGYLERFGVPAGIGLALMLLALAEE